MIDVLAPLALLALAAGVVFFVLAARRQRAARRALFRDLADATDRRYLKGDDGTAERLAEGFQGFGVFHSPSLGATVPEAVVVGQVAEGTICHFLHGTRELDGQAREWTVCLVEAPEPLCGGAAVRIRPREVATVREIGGTAQVSFADDREFDEGFAVTSSDPSATRACLGTEMRSLLASGNRPGARPAPLAVEVQIRDRRLAVYLARRDDEARNVDNLRTLEDLARRLSATLLKSGA